MSVIFDNLGSPWAGIGKDVGGAESVTDAMQKAGLDWTVSKEPMFLADGREVTQKAVVRSDSKDVLGYVTPKWTPYQNADAFKWFEPFVEENEVEFSTAGAFKQGRITWILARLNRDNSEIAAGDEVEKYLLLSNSHDGKLAVRVGLHLFVLFAQTRCMPLTVRRVLACCVSITGLMFDKMSSIFVML